MNDTSTRRIDALRAECERRGLDGLLITHAPHAAYLTGFTGSNALLALTLKEAHFFTDGRYAEQAREELTLPEAEIHIERQWWKYIEERKLFADAVKLGFEASHTSVAAAQTMTETLKSRSLKPLTGVVEAVTMIKTEAEVAAVREAAAIAAKVYEHVLSVVKAGMTENDVAAEVAYIAKKLGSEGEGFETIVASGARGALPHGRASGKTIEFGELVTLDFGCRARGFYSDMTRTFAVGEPPKYERGIFELVLRANIAAIEAAKGGMKATEIDAIAREIITEVGYGENFPHGLGHGLGREVHEKPSVSYLAQNEIAPAGAIITIEPGVYVSGRCGVRIEDDVWLTATGCEVLTARAPKHLVVVE
jgi:Xaa-Pro aminopeptidase